MPPAILPRSPPPLMEELVEEILLRLPPDEPAHLFRAAAVCKAWRTMLSDSSGSGFLRRYRKFHGTPPMLGYIHTTYNYNRPHFVATTSTAFPPSLSLAIPVAVNVSWEVLDCRRGRVLMYHAYSTSCLVFVIWDPIITGSARKHVVALHGRNLHTLAAAVMCARDGCDHLDCHGGPFRLVLVEKLFVSGEDVVRASIYSSVTDAWTTVSDSIVLDHFEPVNGSRSLLIRDALYFSFNSGRILTNTLHLKYDLGSHGLSVIDTSGVRWDALAIKAEDGGLGFTAVLEDNCIYLWSWKQYDGGRSANGTTSGGGGGRWARHMAINLNKLASLPTHCARSFQSRLVGYIEGTDTIFVCAYNTTAFTLDLKSRLVRKVNAEAHDHCRIIPYMSFYTPGII
ncbi:hypothetical protein BS78_02G019500 [Paspalum vaginatum]|nr:hypothetical protein BS78_02G019500 [Paspalum vaginatum]